MKFFLLILYLVILVDANSQQLKQPISCCDIYYETNRIMDTITIVIDGIVIDGASQKPIEGVNILFENEQSEFLLSSDKNGRFRLFHISSGQYTVLVNADNYCTINTQLKKIGSGSGVDMIICLSRSQ